MRLTADQQRDLIPDHSVHVAFLRRDDIKDLGSDEQERRWQEHLKHLEKFREFLARCECVGVISESETQENTNAKA